MATITNTTIAGLVGATEKVLGATVDFIAPKTNELVQSGLTASSPVIDKVASGPRKASVPFLAPLGTDNVNVSTDNINDDGNVESMTADEFMTMRLDLNNAWGFADLQRVVTQYDAKGGVAAMLADWQNGIDKKLLSAALTGVRALTATNSTITSTVTGDFDMAAVYAAAATAEEWADLFKIMMVSHGRYAKMQAKEANGFVPASRTGTQFADYQGYTLIRTNTLTDDQVVLARTGAIAYGTGNPEGVLPVEYERRANGGNGGGADILHKRFSRVIHPQGLDYVGAIANKTTDVYALLAAKANWNLKIPAQQFGFRFINFNKPA